MGSLARWGGGQIGARGETAAAYEKGSANYSFAQFILGEEKKRDVIILPHNRNDGLPGCCFGEGGWER